MKLGIISGYTDKDLTYVASKGLKYVELTINRNESNFFENKNDIKSLIKKHDLKVFSIGRWGTNRISETGINEEELQINYRLIDACQALDSPLFVTGVNYIQSISEEKNIEYALSYLNKIVNYANQRNIKVAVYNCRWNNFIVGPDMWDIVLKNVVGLGIKYDPSHAIYDFKDYLKEIKDYGKYFYHVHLKGSLIVDNERVDDPPAGLDMTDWKAVMSLLYYHNYQEGLSIEPHSSVWTHELGNQGIDYTISYFKPLILGGLK